MCTTIKPVLQSPRATTTVLTRHSFRSPSALEPVLHNQRGHRDEKPATAARESPLLTATRERRAAKKNYIYKVIITHMLLGFTLFLES